jgi:hypothetical protein
MRRTTEGKPGSSTLELVELCCVIEYGSIHLGTIRVSRCPHDVVHSYDAMSAMPADEIPVMAGIWFCLHSSVFAS